MKHASLVVLALVAEKPRHGYALEREIVRRNIRLWARIGSSTVYKTLHDLKREGCLESEAGQPTRGAGREVFSITALGRERLSELVARGFRSEASAFSDRIVAMVFAGSVESEAALEGLRTARNGNDISLDRLQQARSSTEHPMAHVILDFYTAVMTAEREAMAAAAEALGLHLNSENRE